MTHHVIDVRPLDIYPTCADQVDRFVDVDLTPEIKARAKAMLECIQGSRRYHEVKPHAVCAAALYASWRYEGGVHPRHEIASACGVSSRYITQHWAAIRRQYDAKRGGSR